VDKKTLKDLHQLPDNSFMLGHRHAVDAVDHSRELGFHTHPISLYPTSVGTVAVMYARRSGQK
jgi:hypothetical protein